MTPSIVYVEWLEAHVVYTPVLPDTDPPIQLTVGMPEQETAQFLRLITTYSGADPTDGYIIPTRCIQRCFVSNNGSTFESKSITQNNIDIPARAAQNIQILWNDAAFFSKYRQVHELPQLSTTGIVEKIDSDYMYIKHPKTKLITETNYPRKQSVHDEEAQYVIIPFGMIVCII